MLKMCASATPTRCHRYKEFHSTRLWSFASCAVLITFGPEMSFQAWENVYS